MEIVSLLIFPIYVKFYWAIIFTLHGLQQYIHLPFLYRLGFLKCLRLANMLVMNVLAIAIIYFYNSARATSTTRTYKTGQRWWAWFHASFPSIPALSLPTRTTTSIGGRTRNLRRSFGPATVPFTWLHRYFLLVTRPHGVAQGRLFNSSTYLSSSFVANVMRGIYTRFIPLDGTLKKGTICRCVCKKCPI